MSDSVFDAAYQAMEDSSDSEAFNQRHGVQSAPVLTIKDDESAMLVAEYLRDRLTGKVVVEVGGGIGLLAMYMSEYVKQVFVIEANPVWTSAIVNLFYKHKPANLTFIFGRAQEMAGHIKADVAIFATHSAVNDLRAAAELLAPEVLDVYGELAAKVAPDIAPLRALGFNDYEALAKFTPLTPAPMEAE